MRVSSVVYLRAPIATRHVELGTRPGVASVTVAPPSSSIITSPSRHSTCTVRHTPLSAVAVAYVNASSATYAVVASSPTVR